MATASISAVFRLDGKVAFVTGAASGIGAATAATLARNGADVAMAYFAGDPYDVAPVARAVEAEGRRALTLECDVEAVPPSTTPWSGSCPSSAASTS